MPKSVKVVLGDREYIVAEKYSGITEKWRKYLRESAVFVTLQSLDGVLDLVGKIIEGNEEKLDVTSITALARFVPTLLNLSNSMDDIKNLIFDYVPEMADDRQWIDENVYDSEIVVAFVEVLKINFPILGVWDLFRNGSKAPGISTNLPSTNGTTGTKKPTARLKTR